MTTFTEADVEQAALDWLSGLGWGVAHGPDIAPETPHAECADYDRIAGPYLEDIDLGRRRFGQWL